MTPLISPLPNLFVVGAPKCGTTSLVRWLAAHPDVYFPALKEPHYFNTDDRHRNVRSLESYRRLYRRARPHHHAIGDASVWYLSSRRAVGNILRTCRDARFIVMLRSPLEMAPSLHQQNLYGLYEDVEDFAEAWGRQEQRRRGGSIPATCRDPRHLLYGDACRLGMQMQELLERVDRQRMMWVFLDDLKSSPRVVYGQVLQFLELPDDGRASFEIYNAAKSHRSRALGRLIRLGSRTKRSLGITRSFGLDRANVKASPRPPLRAETRAMLRDYFAADVRQLGSVTGRNLSGWLDIECSGSTSALEQAAAR